MNELFYIQDTRTFCGNAAVWWRPNGNGYTSYLGQAGKFERERAERICRIRSTDKMWPCEAIDAKAHQIFDMQDFREMERGHD